MSEDPKPELNAPSGAGAREPLPPFEPDEDLITYLESGRDSQSRVDTSLGAGASKPPSPFAPDEDLITYLEKGRKT